ncbi:hypothetical protein NVV95_07520 [Herbiconiux sp. CPCC 205716]|uniref:DUF4352 domain-containing protein n=1 Tax=Herbiconiux gentiana TaxID=2970912 RepID=A0ABT2GDY8_9MICO|nr:hypothetical protein [Herbiconiux gentiana]MCS5714402.1 hypothetical protein [Herbiconiux gentiana]
MPSTPPLPPLPPLPPSFGGRDDDGTPPRAAAPAPAPVPTPAPAAGPARAAAPAAVPAHAAAPAPVVPPAPAEPNRWELKRPGNPLPGTAPATPSRSPAPVRQPPARALGHAHGQVRAPRNPFLVPGLVLAGLAFVLVVVLGVVFAVGVIGAAAPGALLGGQAADGEGPAASATEVVPALYDQTVTYDDGLQISVAAPESFSPSPQASGAGQPANIALTVTVYNGSANDFVPGTVTSVTSAGASGNPIVDPSNGMTGLPPAATVAPGATVSYVEAYSVADADDVVYVVTPAPAYLPARFTR